MTTHVYHAKHKDHKELAAKLQLEVDSILTTVKNKGEYSEFREREVIDIHDISDKPLMTELIDHRIHEIATRHQRPSKVLKQTEHVLKHTEKVGKNIHKVVNYLFKPFEL
ncbi:MAG: hypothetical protein V4519_01850 [Patescibacteria group bacterium]